MRYLTTLFFISLIAVNIAAFDVALLGSRSDINFLNAEGDIILPLKYEYKDSGVDFIVIDTGVNKNDSKYKEYLSLINGNQPLPVIVINGKVFAISQLTDSIVANSMKNSIKSESKKNRRKKRTAKSELTVRKDREKKAFDDELGLNEKGSGDMAMANTITMVVTTICGAALYFARKKYLKK